MTELAAWNTAIQAASGRLRALYCRQQHKDENVPSLSDACAYAIAKSIPQWMAYGFDTMTQTLSVQ
jgi:hypothetical protein